MFCFLVLSCAVFFFFFCRCGGRSSLWRCRVCAASSFFLYIYIFLLRRLFSALGNMCVRPTVHGEAVVNSDTGRCCFQFF